MKEFRVEEESSELFEGFKFVLSGKEYIKKNIDQKLFNALTSLDENSDFDKLAIALVGENEFKKSGPFNILELMALSKWIFEEFINPFMKSMKKEDSQDETGEVKNESDE